MLRRISGLLVNIIASNRNLDDKEKNIYEYCIRTILRRTLFVTIILILGIVTKQASIALLFLATFFPLRSLCGGTHAATPLLCTILSYGISMIVLLSIPFLSKHFPYIVIFAVFFGACIPIALFAPVDTKNKRFNIKQRKKLKIKLLLYMILMSFVFVFFSLIQGKTYCMTITLCVIISSVSILFGYFQNRREKK